MAGETRLSWPQWERKAVSVRTFLKVKLSVTAFVAGLALPTLSARANECCEFASPQGCASAPVIDADLCLTLGGFLFMRPWTCNLATGDCDQKTVAEDPRCIGIDDQICTQLVRSNMVCAACPHQANWVDTCASNYDFLNSTQAEVGIDMNMDGLVDQTVNMLGPTRVLRRSPVGTNPATIETEIVAMTLTGGGMTLRAGIASPGIPMLRNTTGQVAERTEDNTLADSFFDVIFEIDLGGGQKLFNHDALRVAAVIGCAPPAAEFIKVGAQPVPLFPDPEFGLPQAQVITVRHILPPPPPKFGACCLPNNGCILDVTDVECHAIVGGHFEGDGTTFCRHNPDGSCTTGACCLPNKTCQTDVTEEECIKADGRFLGVGTISCPDNCFNIPTVSEWGLVVMAVLVLTAATVVIMRRRAMVRGGV